MQSLDISLSSSAAAAAKTRFTQFAVFCNAPPCWLCFPRPSLFSYSLVLNATWKGDLGTWGDFLGMEKVRDLAPAIVFEVSLSMALKQGQQMSLIKKEIRA